MVFFLFVSLNASSHPVLDYYIERQRITTARKHRTCIITDITYVVIRTRYKVLHLFFLPLPCDYVAVATSVGTEKIDVVTNI